MLPFCTRLAPVMLAVFLGWGALPLPTHAQVTRNDYAARRAALVARIDSGVVVAFGGVEPVSYWPTFYQLPAFYYLTGFRETDAVFILVKRNSVVTAEIFVPTRSAVRERWIGARTRVADLLAKTGIAGRDIAQLFAAVDSLADSGLPFYVIPDIQASDYGTQDSLTRGSRFLSQVRLSHPWLVMRSLDTAVSRLRAKKSAGEIALLRKAAQISLGEDTGKL